MANGIIPYFEMPSTLMLLEKLRGAAPKLIDATTLSETGSDEHVGNGNAGIDIFCCVMCFPVALNTASFCRKPRGV
jgi:hypothetical protein